MRLVISLTVRARACRWFLGAQRSSRSEVQHGEEVVPHVRQSIARPTERPDEYQKEEDDDGRRDNGSQAIPLALLGILHVGGLSRGAPAVSPAIHHHGGRRDRKSTRL